jgi:hypothetical protein
MPQLTHKMGGDSVVTNTLAVLFTDGTEQFTAGIPASLNIQCGVALFTGGTVSTVTFATPYTAVQAPIVVVTGLNSVYTHSLFESVASLGSNGAWTGFTLTISAALFGAYNWLACGNPN